MRTSERPPPWALPGDPGKITADMRAFFADAAVRFPGSPGNLAAEEKVAKRFEASGFAHGEITFEAPTFVPGKTRLTINGMAPISLLPLAPTQFRPGNFTEKQFTTNLVYAGRGTSEDLLAITGQPLDGAVVVMEFDSGDAWLRFLRFGVRGFIFIGQDEYYHRDAISKVYDSEVAVPRFFVDAATGAGLKELLSRANAPAAVTIDAEPSRWRNAFLRDHWVLIPGSEPELAAEVVVFVAPIDSACVVPELAAGGRAGANLYLLIRLLDEFRKEPPARSVLLAAVNAHTQSALGDRMLAWHLLTPTTKVSAVRNLLADKTRFESMLLQRYRKINPEKLLSENPDEETVDYLIRLQTLTDRSTGHEISVKEPIVTLAKRDVNRSKIDKITVQRMPELPAAEKKRRLAGLDRTYRQYVNVLTLFNKVGIRTTLRDLSADEKQILRNYVDEVIGRYATWSTLNQRDLDIDKANSAIRDALAGRTVAFLITLDLDWDSERIGFSWGDDEQVPRTEFQYRFGLNSTEIANALATEFGGEADNPWVDTMTNVGGLGEPYFFPSLRSSALGIYQRSESIRTHAGTPAFSLANVFTDQLQAFTPADTLDRLDVDVVHRLMTFAPIYLRRLLRERKLSASSELLLPNFGSFTRAIQIKAFKFDDFAASQTPQFPVAGSVIILSGQYFLLTDTRAVRIFYGVSDGNQFDNQAFHYDDDFIRIDYAMDIGEIQERLMSRTLPGNPSLTLPLFPCREVPIYERNDPSLISFNSIGVTAYEPLLGPELNTTPRKFGMSGLIATGPVSIFFPTDNTLKVITPSKRLVLNASDEHPEGIGFSAMNPIPADFFAVAAADMSYLNHERLRTMQGVRDELAEAFVHRGDQAIDRMRASKSRHDPLAYLRNLYEALGSQVKAYQRIVTLTNDMLKAVVFFMALLLPFCFFMQKLIFKFVKIEAQMVAFAIFFVLTFFVFRFIHPAFRIAMNPEAMLIAFVMGALGVFVIYILHSRFEGEMKLLFSNYLGTDKPEVGFSTVGQKAMLVGVNNMKRRRIRTLLTAGTIVLVTFTMLAFTSISTKMSPTIVPISKDAPYTGIFFQWPGSLRMDEPTLQVFRHMFTGRCETIVVRRWLLPVMHEQRGNITFPYRVERDRGQVAQIDGVLGLPTADFDFLDENGMPLLSNSRWFSSDTAREIILPADTAATLKIGPTDIGSTTLDFWGHQLTVVGIVDNERFRSLRDLNNRPILPVIRVDASVLSNSASLSSDAEKLASEKLDPVSDSSSITYVDTGRLLILPVGTAKRLGAMPFSVSVRFRDSTPIWPVMDEVLTATRAKFYLGSRTSFSAGPGSRETPAGTYYIGSGYRTSIAGLTRLFIPLLIAATIILNTMLGSIFERRHEIAIYNAIGLNPTYIGLFFLAEAFVYGIIGSVGGYLTGQAFAIFLTKFNIVTGINLNFSSISVVSVILFSVAIVLVSTVYPAVTATRAAVPSGKRKWSLPEHDGQQMQVVFPFIYQANLVVGVMNYIEEYLSRFSEASVGGVIAELQRRSKTKDELDRDIYTLEYNMALAPFDQGVTQNVCFRSAYDEQVQNYRMVLTIDRISGQDANWVTTNKPFLDKLRKFLMQWRNLGSAQHGMYALHGKEIFG